MQLLVKLHFTVKEQITPEPLYLYYDLHYKLKKSLFDRSTDTLTCMLKMGKADSASSKSRECMPVWGVYARR